MTIHKYTLKICHKCYSAVPSAIKRESTISTSSFTNCTRHTEKCEIWEKFVKMPTTPRKDYCKRILKVRAAWKGRPENDVKDSTWTQSFSCFLFSQIKSDNIPRAVKLDDVSDRY